MHHERIDASQGGKLELNWLREQVTQLERCLSEVKAALWPERLRHSLPEHGLDEQRIRNLQRARRRRQQDLGPDLFGDPAWDILLEALAAELGQQRTSVSGLCHASAVPATTALRWIKKLEQDGWLVRRADPFDGRRHWIELSEDGSAKLRRYFSTAESDLIL